MIDDEVHPMFVSPVTVVFYADEYNTVYKFCPLKFDYSQY